MFTQIFYAAVNIAHLWDFLWFEPVYVCFELQMFGVWYLVAEPEQVYFWIIYKSRSVLAQKVTNIWVWNVGVLVH